MAVTKGKVLVNLEVTPAERKQIQDNAAWFGLSMAEFIRLRTLTPYEPKKVRA